MLKFGLGTSTFSTVLAIIILSFCVVLLCDILNINNNILVVLTSIIFVSTPNITNTLTYFFCSNGYCLGFLMAILAVYFTYRANKKIYFRIIASSLCIAFSMALYQSYLGVVCGLYLIVPILDIVKGKENDFKKILKKILECIISGILGGAIYYGVWQILLYVNNLSATSYSGINEVGIQNILNFKENIVNCYMDFFRYFFTDKIVKNLGYNRKILNAIVLISTIVEIIILMEKNKVYEKTENLIQTIVFIWLLPFAICVIRFFATNREMNVLMSPAFILIFIMNISLLEEICKISKANILTLINIIVLVIITWTYIISANATYELTILNYNKAISTVERIVANVEQMEEYSSGMPIIFCGIIENDNLTEVENMRLNRLSTGGVSEYNVLWEDFGDEQNGYFNLLVDFLGKDLGYVSNEKYMEIIQSDEFKEMDVYPNGNSIKIIDNCVVVKMQETPYELKQIETTEN
jgi:hypothetical protein